MKQMSTSTVSPKTQESTSGVAATRVFVVDSKNTPLMPCTPKRARLLLKSKKADVYRAHPFTIRILGRIGGDMQESELKIDPGSKTTGFALIVNGAVRGWFCISAWELSHRGQQITKDLLSRRQLRSGRRSRKTRYREPRFLNRAKKSGWLPPSLQSRVDNVVAFSKKLQKVCPISSIAVEDVRFDTQLMQNPDISGVEYQQGELHGYEVREYQLLKWGHACAYCQITNVPLQIDHIIAKSKGGSNRVSNLCIACATCNQKKGNRSLTEFLKDKPELLAKIERQAKAPLKDAAAVNSTRKALVASLKTLGVLMSTGSGGLTKFHRTRQGYTKAHWIDAACIGSSGAKVDISRIRNITQIQAKGRGSRQMRSPNKFGFPRTSTKTVKRLYGFQTGDLVRLKQPNGKYKGVHEGVVAIRATGMFDIITSNKARITAPYKRFTLLSRFDGYTYTKRAV